eukprot:Rmarinus@m.2428
MAMYLPLQSVMAASLPICHRRRAVFFWTTVSVDGAQLSNSGFVVLVSPANVSIVSVASLAGTNCSETIECGSVAAGSFATFGVIGYDSFANQVLASTCLGVTNATMANCSRPYISMSRSSWLSVVEGERVGTVIVELTLGTTEPDSTSLTSFLVAITPALTSAATSYITSPSAVLAGEEWTVEVFHLDAYGNVIEVPPKYHFSLNLSMPSEQTVALVTDSGAGSEEFAIFYPTMAGSWEVTVLYVDSVVGSTLVEVLPSSVSASHSNFMVLSGSEPESTFLAGTAATCLVTLCDVFGNLAVLNANPSLLFTSLCFDTFSLTGDSFESTCTFTDVGVFDVLSFYDHEKISPERWGVTVLAIADPVALRVSHGAKECSLNSPCPENGWQIDLMLSFVVELIDGLNNTVVVSNEYDCIASVDAGSAISDCLFSNGHFMLTIEAAEASEIFISLSITSWTFSASSSIIVSVASTAEVDTLSLSDSFVLPPNCQQVDLTCRCYQGEICGLPLVAGESTPFTLQLMTEGGNTIGNVENRQVLVKMTSSADVSFYIDGVFATTEEYLLPLTVSVATTYEVEVIVDGVSDFALQFVVEAAAGAPSSSTSVISSEDGSICTSGYRCGSDHAVGMTARYFVSLVDAFENPTACEAYYEVDGVGFPLSDEDGSCAVVMLSTIPGDYNIVVFANNDDDEMTATTLSSFLVRFVPAATSPETSHVPECLDAASSSPCLRMTAGAVIQFSIIPCDMYGNCPSSEVVGFQSSANSSSVSNALVSNADIVLVDVSGTMAGTFVISVEYDATPVDSFLIVVDAADALASNSKLYVVSDLGDQYYCLPGVECLNVSAGVGVHFIVEASDAFGNRLVTSRGQQVVAQLSRLSSENITSVGNTLLYDNNDGTFSINANASIAGHYELAVFLDGTELQNSPAVYTVSAASSLSPSESRIDSDFWWFAPAGVSELSVSARDVFGNLLSEEDPSRLSRFQFLVNGFQQSIFGTNNPSQYLLQLHQNTTGSYLASLLYDDVPIYPGTWWFTVVPGTVDPNQALVYLGENLCARDSYCYTALFPGEVFEFELRLFDIFGNEATNAEPGVVYTLTALGVEDETFVGIRQRHGRYSVPVQQYVAADYEMFVYVNGIPVEEAPVLCRYDPRPNIDVNATLSYATWLEMRNDSLYSIQCIDGSFCGTALDGHNREELGYVAGSGGLAMELIQVDSRGILVNESSGLVTTFIMMEPEQSLFNIGSGLARADGKYALSLDENTSGTWRVFVYLGSGLASWFYVVIIPAIPHGPTSQLFDTWHGGTACEIDVVCAGEATVAGLQSSPIAVLGRDQFGNSVNSVLDLVIVGPVGSAAAHSDYLNGTAMVWINSTVAAISSIHVYFEEASSDTELIGSGFLFDVVPSTASSSSSAAVSCAAGDCRDVCVQDTVCPEVGWNAGDILLYSVDLFDQFANPVVLKEVDGFSFALNLCNDVSCTYVDAEYTSTYERFMFMINATSASLHAVSVVGADYMNLRNSPFLASVAAGPPTAASQIWTPATNPRVQCKADLLCASVTAGTEFSLVIIVYDKYLNEWSCVDGACNFESQNDVFAEVAVGGSTLPLALPDSTGRFPVYFTRTTAQDWLVDASLFSEDLGTYTEVADSGFMIRIEPAQFVPALSIIHTCMNSSVSISHCRCYTGAECIPVIAGTESSIFVRLLDTYNNAVPSPTAGCTASTTSYERGCQKGESSDLVLPLKFTIAGDYQLTVLVSDDGGTASLAANSGFIVRVNPGTMSAQTSQIFLSDGTHYTHCSALTICGNSTLPGSEMFVVVVLRDQFSNLLSNDDPLTSNYLSIPDFEGPETVLGSLLIYDGIGGFSLTHYLVGEYRVFVDVEGLDLAASDFRVVCATLELNLFFNMVVTTVVATGMDSVESEILVVVAAELQVPVELLNVTATASMTSNSTNPAETSSIFEEESPVVASLAASESDSFIPSMARRRLHATFGEYYRVSLMYHPPTRDDLTIVENSVLQLNASDVSGETFTTETIEDVNNNEEDVVNQVNPKTTGVQYETSLRCHSGERCPTTATRAGETVVYTLMVSDSYTNPINVDMDWLCSLQLYLVGDYEMCSRPQSGADCACEPDSSHPGWFKAKFSVTRLDESFMDRSGDLWSYSLVFEVGIIVLGEEIDSSGFEMEIVPDNVTSVEHSLLLWEPQIPLDVTAGASVPYIVESRDKYGNLRPTSADEWVAVLNSTVNETSATKRIPLEASSPEGRYLFQPSTLQLVDEYVAGFMIGAARNFTEWTVHVVPAETSASTCVVSVLGVDEGFGFEASDGRDHRLVIEAFDSFGNRQTAYDTFVVSYAYVSSNLTANLQLPYEDVTPGWYERPFAARMDEIGLIRTEVRLRLEFVDDFILHVQCPAGYVEVDSSYLGWSTYFGDDSVHPNYCEPCPSVGADCSKPGQTLRNLQHQSGYWRASSSSLRFTSCFNTNSYFESELNECGDVGSDCQPCMNVSSWTDSSAGESDVGGQCRAGYRGRLCSLCEPGYSRNYNFECSHCEDKYTVYLMLLLYLVVMSLYVGFLILIEYAADVKDPAPGAAMKIVTHFLQMSIFIRMFGLDRARKYIYYEAASKVVVPLSEELSVDCVFYYFGITKNLYINRMRSVAVFPLLLVVVIVVVVRFFERHAAAVCFGEEASRAPARLRTERLDCTPRLSRSPRSIP